MDEDFGVDLDQVRAFLADRARRRRARVDERYAQATRDAQAIVSEIAARVNPRRIYQWGSLLDRRRFSEISERIAFSGRTRWTKPTWPDNLTM